jgi:hypothetical protein
LDEVYIIDCGPDFINKCCGKNVELVNECFYLLHDTRPTRSKMILALLLCKIGEMPIYFKSENIAKSVCLCYFSKENRYPERQEPPIVNNEPFYN